MSGSVPDGSLLSFVVRMVIPMRREFGRSLDVQQFMRDGGYARIILDQALTSRDQRLLDYAEYVNKHMQGARSPSPAATAPPIAERPAAAQAVEAPASVDRPPTAPAAEAESEQERLRKNVLRKYTGGLR